MVRVTIDQGTLVGTTETDYLGDNFFAFRGIPYAKPPLGPLRFRPPMPPDSWEGERDASKPGDGCYAKHMITREPVGSEDCLFLNVYTPCVPTHPCDLVGLLAVMVWVHGGSFTTGSGGPDMYSPDYLVTNDVVVVTINYRLGILGNLAVRDEVYGIPGNSNIRDIVMALKWVQSNIKHFQGDPYSVTLFGESAGGTMVHHTLISPLSRGLIHKVIAQSGCAMNIWSYGRRFITTIAKMYDFEHENEAVDMLLKMPLIEILGVQGKIDAPPIADTVRCFGPVLDNMVDDPVMPMHPLQTILTKNYHKVPLMIGYNTREGMLFDIIAKRTNTSKFGLEMENFIPFDLNIPKGSELSKKVANLMNTFYFNGSGLATDHTDEDYMLRSDIFFIKGIYRSARKHNDKVYLYRMSVETELNIYKKLSGATVKGVCHLDDVFYMWKTYRTPNITKGSLEDITIHRVTKLWTNFAKYGNPTPDPDDSLLGVTWKPVERNSVNFLDIGANLTLDVNPDKDRMDLWEKLYTIIPTMNICNDGISVYNLFNDLTKKIFAFGFINIFWLFK